MRAAAGNVSEMEPWDFYVEPEQGDHVSEEKGVEEKEEEMIQKQQGSPMGIIFLIIGYFCFLNMDIFQYARDKIATSNGGDESSSLRLFFTASVWAELPIDLKILGIPNFSIGDFLLQNSKYIPNQLVWVLQDESSINYASSIWFVAVKFGLVVWIVYLFF